MISLQKSESRQPLLPMTPMRHDIPHERIASDTLPDAVPRELSISIFLAPGSTALSAVYPTGLIGYIAVLCGWPFGYPCVRPSTRYSARQNGLDILFTWLNCISCHDGDILIVHWIDLHAYPDGATRNDQ
jgi:hypothetical protein